MDSQSQTSNSKNILAGSIIFATSLIFLLKSKNYFCSKNGDGVCSINPALSKPKHAGFVSAPDKKILETDPLLKGTKINYSIDNIYIHEIKSLSTAFPIENVENIGNQSSYGKKIYNKIISNNDFILNDIVKKINPNADKEELNETEAWVRAGPRKLLHFNPKDVKAAIVTCGGLCPGINNVIREIVHTLINLYEVQDIYGIR